MAETVTLANGAKIPQIGLGTWKAKIGEVGKAVKTAIECGYRHIDCASNYLNEDEIGDTITDLIKSGTVKREDLFITGKLNNPYHHKEHVRPHLLKTLKDLNIEYIDLYLIHWPVAFAYVPFDPNRRGFDDDYDPNDCKKVDLTPYGGTKIDRTVSIRETWEAMEEIQREGLARSIGVSNFSASLIHDLLTYAKIKPAVNQIELHPYLQHEKLVKYCRSQNILVEAYSPLGTSDFKGKDEPTVLEDQKLKEIGDRHGKSVAAVTLRWIVQRGLVTVPKSVNPQRIAANLHVFDFSLTDQEMKEISLLDRNYHFLRPEDWYGIPIFH